MPLLIPYDTETLRLLNASGLSLDTRRFAESEFAGPDRAWAMNELAALGRRRGKRGRAWAAAAVAYFSPR